MMSNSVTRLELRRIARPGDLVGPQPGSDLLEHAVDEAMAFGAAEALAELDRLVDHHLERRFRMRHQLERADVQDRALDWRELGQLAVEMRHDQALQLGEPVAHAGDQRLDEAAVALVEAFQAARLLHRIAARELPGIERLQGDFAGLASSALHAAAASVSPSRRRRAPPRRPCPGEPRPVPRLRWCGCRWQSAGRTRAPPPSRRAPTRSPP